MTVRKTPSRTFVTISESAAYLGVAEKTIRRYISAGKLNGYRVGARMIRIDQTELDALARPMPNASTR